MGPYCELCEAEYLMTAEGCVKCSGSVEASFILPILFLVAVIGVAVYLCRTGRMRALENRTIVTTMATGSMKVKYL